MMRCLFCEGRCEYEDGNVCDKCLKCINPGSWSIDNIEVPIKLPLVSNKTLLDEFAMAALPSLINPNFVNEYNASNYLAENSYIIAQAMMEERKKYERN